MNIILINPPNIPFSEQKLLIEPIDIITLGTYLQKQNHYSLVFCNPYLKILT